MRRSRLGAVVALALLALLPAGAAVAQAPAPAVVVAPAEVSDLRERFTFNGRLVASQRIDLRARVAGFLRELAFEEGRRVEKGALLYRIESDPYRAEVAQIRGAIAAAEAQRDLAEIERGRKAQLVERRAVAQSELDVALANLGRAEGEIERLQGQLARAELDVAYTEVRAPFAGVAGLTRYDVGAFVGPESGALTTLTRLDPMTVEFPVATAQILPYRRALAAGEAAGQGAPSVTLRLPDGTTYDRGGRIDFVDATVNAGTDTVTVRAVFDNPEGLLPDGALVGVELEGEAPEPVLSVPQRAVQRDQVGPFVMVVDAAGRVELRRVTVARTTRGRSVVAEGLDAGELVITEGLNKVRPGITVDAATASDG